MSVEKKLTMKSAHSATTYCTTSGAKVTDDEVQRAHRYAQRILEDFYDDRPTVEAILTAKKRLPVSLQQPAAP
jgi:hypothetical protein